MRQASRHQLRSRVLSGLALLLMSTALAGCALSGSSKVDFPTNAQVADAPVASHAPSRAQTETRFERLARRIVDEAAAAPSSRREVSHSRTSETSGLVAPLKGGGIIFMEVTAESGTRARGRRAVDPRQATEVFVGQQSTPHGTQNFGLDIAVSHRRLNASCEHGQVAVAEIDSGKSIEALLDVGKKNHGYRLGQTAAAQLLGRVLATAQHVVGTTDFHRPRVRARADACQAITEATFGHGL